MDHLSINVPRIVAHSHVIEQEAKRIEQAGRQLAELAPVMFGGSGPALSELIEKCSTSFVLRAEHAGEASRSIRAFAERVERQDEEAIAP